MDNSNGNQIINSIMNPINSITKNSTSKKSNSALSSLFSSPNTGSSTSSVGSSNSNSTSVTGSTNPGINWTTWFLIIIVLSIFGINIFVYLAEITEFIEQTFEKITKWIASKIGTPIADTTKQTVNVSATGTKSGINTVANTADQTIDTLTKPFQPNSAYTSQSGEPIQPPTRDILTNDEVTNTITNTTGNTISNAYNSIQPEDSYSSINQSSGKSGWCFIGEDEGIRSCIKVGLNDTCMSGDIFPTSAVCVNPNLRV